jgi:hypothetical protein
VSNGSTVSVCTIGLSKLLDRMNHCVVSKTNRKETTVKTIVPIGKVDFRVCLRWGDQNVLLYSLSTGEGGEGFCHPFCLHYVLMV